MFGGDAVADTSVIQYLYRLRRLDLLDRLFDQRLMTSAVNNELVVGRNKGELLPSLEALSTWNLVETPPEPRFKQHALGPGERSVLAYALSTGSTALLDDFAARKEALRLGIDHTGVLGILVEAKKRGLVVSLTESLHRLVAEDFWIHCLLLANLIASSGE